MGFLIKISFLPTSTWVFKRVNNSVDGAVIEGDQVAAPYLGADVNIPGEILTSHMQVKMIQLGEISPQKN